jgi:uncharacterized repeat protein (TIGR03803 family)
MGYWPKRTGEDRIMTASYRSLSSRRRAARFAASIIVFAGVAIALPAQTFTTLHSFDGTDGYEPSAPLVQATNGDFYGTTNTGGANGVGGTVFKITPSGTLTTLYNFCSQGSFPSCTDGFYPEDAGLVQAANGDLYGTTEGGGVVPPDTIPGGTVFKITPGGALTTLYTFCSQLCTGALPFSGLVQAANGDLYGTTVQGAPNGYPGTIFKITPGGVLTTLYTFCAQVNCADGNYPYAPLVQATNGYFYGTTTDDGAYGSGTIFKITPSGTLTTLYSFCSQSGCPAPYGSDSLTGLVQAANGDLYGTTNQGGDNNVGTVFKITPSGTLTTLYSFGAQANGADGFYPAGALIQATDGNFYGTTSSGGTPSGNGSNRYSGTVFKITPAGALTTLYSFCTQSECADGSGPTAGLVQATNGDFYGTTAAGGVNGGYGTVFRLSVGLGPFVELQTTSGKVGARVKILGNSLTHASSVTFNGTAAVFTASASEITTTVPAGAATGTVQVVTEGDTLSSNVPFRVTP